MKRELRKKYLEIRKNLKDKRLKDKVLFEKIIASEKVKNAKEILIYVSKDDEVSTTDLIEYFLNQKKIVAVPKVVNQDLEFHKIKSFDDLSIGYKGILEPNKNNKIKTFKSCISITPGICFSKDGYRIGYGKGFYDRFYQKNNIYKIGLCYKECITDDKFWEKHDVKVDEVKTD